MTSSASLRGLRRAAAEAAIILFFLALALQATWPLALQLRTHTLAGGDPLVDLWTIHWLVEHFFEKNRVFQGNTFVPAPHAVLYSDLTLGTVVLLLPLQPLRLDPVLLYNLALLATLTFAGWGFFCLGRGLTGSWTSGILCGVLSGFASHQLYHVYHVNLLAIGWLGLFLLALVAIARHPTVPRIVLASLSFALSAQSSGYYGVAAALLAIAFAAMEPSIVRRRLLAFSAAAAGAVVLLLPYLLAYHGLQSTEGLERPVGMSVAMAFHPTVDLGSHSWALGAIVGRGGERLFPGVLAPVLAFVAWRRGGRVARFLAVAALTMLVISLGPYLAVGGVQVPLPYLALRAVPAFESMRHPYTFAAVATFLLAALAAVGWTRLALSRRRWAAIAVVALSVVETLGLRPDLQALPAGLPPHYDVLFAHPRGPVLEVPVFGEESLLAAARHGEPMLNGQGSAFVPLDTLRLARMIDNHWLEKVPADVDATKATAFLLQKFPVRYVVLPARRRNQQSDLRAAFARSHVFRLLGEDAQGGQVYEVHPEALPASADLREGGE